MARPRNSLAPIVLLTDFGLKDSYVGVMKGVIAGGCPDARVIDLTHEVSPQDVTEAAFVLATAYRYFPAGTIFVCVVDPGVGAGRRIVCLRANRQTFLAPDNGLLSPVARECGVEAAYQVTNSRYFLPQVSGTFHGRDIFAPVAAHIRSGLELHRLGPPLADPRELSLPSPVSTPEGRLKGEVIHIDHFGNLITNITKETLENTFKCPPGELEIRIKRRRIRGISRTYGNSGAGRLLAVMGSSGCLEVAVKVGSAEKLLKCSKGDSVAVSLGNRDCARLKSRTGIP
jgi:hypothetical protein